MNDPFYEKVIEAQNRAYSLTEQAQKDRLSREVSKRPSPKFPNKALFLTGQALVTLGSWIKAN